MGKRISLFCITFFIASVMKAIIGILYPEFISTNLIIKDIYLILFSPNTVVELKQVWCESGLVYEAYNLIIPFTICGLFFIAFYLLGILYQNHLKKKLGGYIFLGICMSFILLGIFFIILFILEAYSVYTFLGRGG